MGDHLILYDGVCGLCNRLNTFVLPRDRAAVFDFAPLQSETARRVLAPFGEDPGDLNTVFVVKNYRSAAPTLLFKARAILFIVRTLGSPWSLVGIFGVLPDAMLNAVYDLVARSRYRVFGRYDGCRVPSPDWRKRFIDGA